MLNMKAVISSHNKNMLAQDHDATAAPLQQPRTCNCKNRPKCPLQGNCAKENVVYQATVATETTTETYIGLASNFKERYRNHQTSFRHRSKRNETELSNTSGTSKSFHVKWRILRSCQPYSNVSKKCNPCLQENIGVNRSCVNSSFVFYYLLLAWRNHLLNIWCFCDYICILNCRVLPGLASRNRLPKCDTSWT